MINIGGGGVIVIVLNGFNDQDVILDVDVELGGMMECNIEVFGVNFNLDW